MRGIGCHARNKGIKGILLGGKIQIIQRLISVIFNTTLDKLKADLTWTSEIKLFITRGSTTDSVLLISK